jgi:anti-sigma B factor antagonist
MSLEIDKREREGISILDMKGRVTMGDEVSSFRKVVQDLVAAGSQKLILNLQHVDYIDSTGLGAVVMCSTAFRNTGGSSKLLNLNRRNIELLVTTKLATIFEIFDNEQDAVNSFFPGREIKGFDILQFVKTQKPS